LIDRVIVNDAKLDPPQAADFFNFRKPATYKNQGPFWAFF
jgi:hypothetical protein